MGGFVRSGYPGSDLKASHSLTHHTHSMEHSYEAASLSCGRIGTSRVPLIWGPLVRGSSPKLHCRDI